MGHTAGKWMVHHSLNGHIYVHGPHDEEICRVSTDCALYDGSAEDNAQLIASAPRVNMRATRLCNMVEAFFRKGDDSVPRYLQNVTETDIATAMYELRAAMVADYTKQTKVAA